MTQTTKFNPAAKDKRGRAGHRVSLHFDAADGMGGNYQLRTHGRTPAEVKAEHDRLVAHHEEKARRHAGFNDRVRGKEVKAAGESFVITDCNTPEQGTNVRLHLVLRQGAERIEIRKVYRTIHDVPTDQQILQMAREAVIKHADAKVAAKDHEREVRKVLGI